MLLFFFIFIFTKSESLESWDVIKKNHFDILESWGISRMKRQENIPGEKLLRKFPDAADLNCEMFHLTEEAPFTAIILYKTSGRFLCMGSILDKKHILTAKRCYERLEVLDLLVVVGYYKAYWGRYSQVIKVKKIVWHEYEIAMLRLAQNIRFTDYVQAVRLPSSATKMNLEFKKIFPPPYQVVGFFVDRFDVPGDYIHKDNTYVMKEDHLVDFNECKKNYTKIILDEKKMFCTIGNASYCWGGNGAPIVIWLQNRYLQVGVVVADNCTADTTGPLLAIRTDTYADWIIGNSFEGRQPI